MIDRITPTQRPDGPNCGTQTWKSLYFGHWRVPVAWLQPQLPEGLEVDLFEGDAYLGLVPFQMKSIKPHWLPQRFSQNFLETNLRTYCLHGGRPGVFFFSLDANSLLAVCFARWGWSLPYHHARMQWLEQGSQVTYLSLRNSRKSKNHDLLAESRHPGHEISFRPDRELGASSVGTLEHFLFERYLLFAVRNQKIYVGQVHHAPYHVYTARLEQFQQQLTEAAGLGSFSQPPELSHFSPGVDVEIFPLVPSEI